MATTLPFLVGFVYAVIELLKAGFKSFRLFADDEQRTFIVRLLAVGVGVGSTIALQVDVLHPDTPTLAGMIITGAALAVASNLLQIGTDLGNAKATQIANPPASSTSVHVDAQTTTTSTPEQPTPPTPYTAPGYTPTPASSNSHAGFASGASDKITPV